MRPAIVPKLNLGANDNMKESPSKFSTESINGGNASSHRKARRQDH